MIKGTVERATLFRAVVWKICGRAVCDWVVGPSGVLDGYVEGWGGLN